MPISYSIVIPANGTGQRFQNELPKQFSLIRNRPLIYYTIDAFVHCSNHLKDCKLNEIVISCPQKFEDYVLNEIVKPIVEQNRWLKINLVRGGEYRHESIFNCLKHLAKFYTTNDCAEHIILIHDAVRPLIDVNLVHQLIENANRYGASGPVCNLSSTILKPDKDGFLDLALNRDQYKASEMPQSFRFDSVLSAFNKANINDIRLGTECLDLIRKYTDCRIKLIPSDANNLFKVTYQKDYFSALGMLKQRYSYCTWLLDEDLLSGVIDLVEFESNLKLNNSNDLDFEESGELEPIFKLTYGHLILICLPSDEKCIGELMLSCNRSFLHLNKMTILCCLDTNPIDNLTFYEKIKLICNNQHLMIGQFVQVFRVCK